MGPRDDDDELIGIEFPFFRFHFGGQRVRFGDEGEEDTIDMEHQSSADYWTVRRRVRRQLRFVRHLFIFLVVNSVLFLIDWSTGGGFWVQWVALIWGIFLGWEFISRFLAPHLWGREMEERLVQRELRRQRGG